MKKVLKSSWFIPILLIVIVFFITDDNSFSLLAIIAGAVAIFILQEKLKSLPVISCPNCKYSGPAQQITKGSMLIEIILYFLLIIPGLIYSSWRLSSRHLACPKCNFANVAKQ